MKSESASLYFIFTFQTIGFVSLTISCIRHLMSAERRANTGPKWTAFKFFFYAFLTKWCYDTYQLV